MNLFDPLQSTFWLKIGISVLCGGIVGFERQMRGKPAGIRTGILITLSTAVFVGLGQSVAGPHTDPSRILGQVVTGVGFLGGGVMMARHGIVTGVTTAAVIWTLAGIGSVIGMGYYSAAVALSVTVVAILNGVEVLETSVRRLSHGVHRRTGAERGDDPAE